jgi:hypothetical protein
MRRLFDFKCTDGHVTEQFVDDKVEKSTCRQCGKPASRIISPVRSSLDPISGSFPKATNKWVKNREQRMKIERKAIDNHGADAAWDVAK